MPQVGLSASAIAIYRSGHCSIALSTRLFWGLSFAFLSFDQ
jgi:hypothetical protein